MVNTQCTRIVNYMREHGSITQMEALKELGVLRLASRIHDLKEAGYSISGETITVENRYKEKCRVKRYALREERKDYGEGTEGICPLSGGP